MSHPTPDHHLPSSLRTAERKLHEARRVQTEYEAMLKEAKKAVRKCEEKVVKKKIELETFRAKEARQAVVEELWREGYEVGDLWREGYKRGKEDGAWNTARWLGYGVEGRDEGEVVVERGLGLVRGAGVGGRQFVRR